MRNGLTSISFPLDISCSILSCEKVPKMNLTKALFILKEINQILREGNGTPLQYSCLENPMDRGAW